jgi:predicted nucleic acid-binding protein
MKVETSLQGVTRLFIDTAPAIYYVERNPTYFDIVNLIFEQIDNGGLTAITSPITLAECLVHPYRLSLNQLQQDFLNVIVNADHTLFQPIDDQIGQRAAAIRAAYNFTLPDALQLAVALAANCEAFLTNDSTLQRFTELRVLAIDALEA